MEETVNSEGLPRQSIVRRPDFKPDKGGAQVKKSSGSDYQPTSEEEEGEEEAEAEEEEESSSDSDSSERNSPGNIEKKKKGRARFGSDSNSSDDDSDKTKPAKTFPVKMDVKRFYGLSSAPKHKLTPSNNCFYKIGNNTNNDSYAKGGGGLKRGADDDFVNYSTYQRQAARNIKYAYDSNSEEESENEEEEEEEEGGDYKKRKGKKSKFYAVRDSDSDFEVSYTVLH